MGNTPIAFDHVKHKSLDIILVHLFLSALRSNFPNTGNGPSNQFGPLDTDHSIYFVQKWKLTTLIQSKEYKTLCDPFQKCWHQPNRLCGRYFPIKSNIELTWTTFDSQLMKQSQRNQLVMSITKQHNTRKIRITSLRSSRRLIGHFLTDWGNLCDV